MTTNLNHSAYPFFGEIDPHKWTMPGETKREKWAAQIFSGYVQVPTRYFSDEELLTAARHAVKAAAALEAALNEQP